MLGAVWFAPRDVRVGEVAEPVVAPGQIMIEASRNGICGSDVHTYVGSDTGGADTTALSAAPNAGIRALHPRGSLTSVAGWQQPATVDMGVAMVRDTDIRFTMTYEPEVDFPLALRLLTDRIADPDLLISDRIPLVDIVDLGLEELLHHSGAHVQILVEPASG
jgi:threonine dehydrogenase-like Zn-dependent dehydrogenase